MRPASELRTGRRSAQPKGRSGNRHSGASGASGGLEVDLRSVGQLAGMRLAFLATT